MLTGIGKDILIHKITASTIKRVAYYVIDAGFIKLVTPTWLSNSAYYLSRWIAGGYAKAKTLSTFQPKNTPVALDEQAYDVRQEKTEDGYKLSWKHPLSSAGTYIAHVANQGAEYVVNLTYREAAKETGAFIGSYAAKAGFVLYFGAPTLLTLPVYYLCEAPCRAAGSYAMKHGCYYAFGETIYDPLKAQVSAGASKAIALDSPAKTNDPLQDAEQSYTPQFWQELRRSELASRDSTFNVTCRAHGCSTTPQASYQP